MKFNCNIAEDDFKASWNFQDYKIKEDIKTCYEEVILLIDNCAQSLPHWLSLTLKFIYYYYFKYRAC